MIVLKFGGTSVGSAERIKAVAQIILSVPGRKIVVLSAMSGTTDALVAISQSLYEGEWENAKNKVKALEKKYRSVIDDLFETDLQCRQAWSIISPVFEELHKQTHNESFTVNDEKVILSKGEIISIQLMKLTVFYYHRIDAVHLDSLSFMKIGHDGDPDPDFIRKRITPLIESAPDASQLFLAEGYICRNAFGEVDNLRRGGSDYTATLIGEAVHAKEIQIWTDIDGLHNNDPRVVNVTSPVRRLHFGEAAELAHFGAKILHPACIEPARRSNTTVRLLYTLDPLAKGTTISGETGTAIIKAVSAKDKIAVISVQPHPSISKIPTFRDTMNALTDKIALHNIKVDVMSGNGLSYLLAIEHTEGLDLFVKDLEQVFEVEIQTEMTILAVVGNMGWERAGFEAEILQALEDIPIRLLTYGSSKYSLVLTVPTEDKDQAMVALSDHLFKDSSLSFEVG